MAGRNDTEGENHVAGLEGATVSIEIDGLSNAEIGFEGQNEGSNGGGRPPHTLVEMAEPSGEREIDGGTPSGSSCRRNVCRIPPFAMIESNGGQIDRPSEKRLPETSILKEGHDSSELGTDSEHDSRVVHLIPASVSPQGEVSRGCSREDKTILDPEFLSGNNNGGSMLVDAAETAHRFIEGGSSVEMPDSNHGVQENVLLEDGGRTNVHLEDRLNFDELSGGFDGEIMQGEAKSGICEEMQSAKSEVDFDREHLSNDQYQERGLPEEKNGVQLMDREIMHEGPGKGAIEELQCTKDEVDADREFTSKVQNQEGSSSASEIFNRKSLMQADEVKKVGENFQPSEMENAIQNCNTEMFKNMGQHLSGSKRNRDFYEDEAGEDTVSLNSQMFQPGDMVWGKVKSHPWWPGHVFSEAFATASVKRTRREGHVLVAFFGDSSYGWFDPSELIPFEPNFAEKSKQTSSRNFLKAVEEAVDEASRRRAVGVACCCRKPHTFRPASVEGYFAVDVVDYEPGGVYSEQQIKASRDSFQPVEFLSFVKQMALMPRSSEHQSIESMQFVATILAYRRAVFVEFDETYPQAFGVDPVRPPQSAGPLDEKVSRAPLSGPLVIAEALSERSGSSKPTKPKNSKKDKYLFKRRDEPNNQKPSFKENVASLGSAKESQNSHSSKVQNFVFQQRLPSPEEKQRTFLQKNEQQGQLACVENVQSLVEPTHTVQAAVGSILTDMPDKKMPDIKKSSKVGIPPKQKAEKLSDSGGQKASAPKPKHLHREKKAALVRPTDDLFSPTVGQVPIDAPDRKCVGEENQGLVTSVVNKGKEDGNDLQDVIKSQRLLETTVPTIRHSLDMPERLAAESVNPSLVVSYRQEGQTVGNEMLEARASVVPGFSAESKTKSGQSRASPTAGIAQKAKSLKRPPIGSLKDSSPDAAGTNGVQGKMKKKKKKKVALSMVGGDQNHMQSQAEVHRDMLPEKVAHLNSVSQEGSQSQDIQRKDESIGHDSLHVSAGASFKSGIGSTEQLNLRQLVSDLLFLALDPFHAIERNGPANARRVFLRFRSLVYQKSLVLPSAGDAVIQGVARSETSDHKSLVSKTMLDSGDEPPMAWRRTQAGKANETMKSGSKRSLSDHSNVPMKKLKKQQDVKVAPTDRKPSQKVPEGSQGERKELSNTIMAKPHKLDPGRKLPSPAPEAPEPTAINIKFPPGTALPSESQLKARFARFGSLDLSGTRIFYRSGTCRVVFKFKSDAWAAYTHVTRSALFGHGVRYSLKEVNSGGTSLEQDSAKRHPDDGGVLGLDAAGAPPRPRGEGHSELRSRLLMPRQAPVVQLKSCLKKPAPDDAGGNGVAKESPRVKFMLGVEDNSGRVVEQHINGASSGDGAPSVVAMDVNINSKMVQLPTPLPPPPPLPFPREIPQSHYQHNQIVEEKATIDISHQLLSLLLKCNDIVSNVKCTLGYVPYHPL